MSGRLCYAVFKCAKVLADPTLWNAIADNPLTRPGILVGAGILQQSGAPIAIQRSALSAIEHIAKTCTAGGIPHIASDLIQFSGMWPVWGACIADMINVSLLQTGLEMSPSETSFGIKLACTTIVLRHTEAAAIDIGQLIAIA